jgi:hypothetical protein
MLRSPYPITLAILLCSVQDSDTTAKYRGAPALYGFSEVYFNANHTAALVYATDWCGNLCAHGFWVAFAFERGRWQRLNWNSTMWIS